MLVFLAGLLHFHEILVGHQIPSVSTLINDCPKFLVTVTSAIPVFKESQSTG